MPADAHCPAPDCRDTPEADQAAQTLELLAPARDADIALAAIEHGADAVYMGGPAFGARASAGNPVRDFARVVAQAHRYHAKVFATLNTILRDDELDDARQLIWQLYDAGVDALIIQDMGLLALDLPPIALHASTQCDIRTPEKARFLQDVGFSQIVLARELTLPEIGAIRAAIDPSRCLLEFFIHGALCVAYSGQCYISHAHTGRSANRGDCSQACRLPYDVRDAQGRIIARQQHVLSLKDNDQSDNLGLLIDAGIRSFKIEGRYKDAAYVKNVTAHYRALLDAELSQRPSLQAASHGRCRPAFQPDPGRNFNRGSTDYFLQGRKADIGAFDAPSWAGQAVGEVIARSPRHVDIATTTALANGDGLTFFTPLRRLVGFRANRVEALPPAAGDGRLRYRVHPAEGTGALTELRVGTEILRNADAAWNRSLAHARGERRIGVTLTLRDAAPADGLTESLPADALVLDIADAHGHQARQTLDLAFEPPADAEAATERIRQELARLGDSEFVADAVVLAWTLPRHIPNARLKQLRRAAVEALRAVRAAACQRPRPAQRQADARYPESALSYLGNVFNHKAHDLYRAHGVGHIEAAFESHERRDEVSLMITRHCVRYSLSLCPRQTAGVTGVAGTIRADPLILENDRERLTLRFDCKPCEMHVVGRLKPKVIRANRDQPIQFYRTRPEPNPSS